MSDGTLVINDQDARRLRHFLDLDAAEGKGDRGSRRDLDVELRRGRVLPPSEIPPDVVTMNSRVRLTDLDSGEELTYALVYPPDADFAQEKISVLAPVGTALLGERVGSVVEWDVPAGRRRLRIEELLYQPEAAGDYHL